MNKRLELCFQEEWEREQKLNKMLKKRTSFLGSELYHGIELKELVITGLGLISQPIRHAYPSKYGSLSSYSSNL